MCIASMSPQQTPKGQGDSADGQDVFPTAIREVADQLQKPRTAKTHDDLFASIDGTVSADAATASVLLDILEPRPITNEGVLQAVDTVDTLPWNIITCCDEFIEALSPVNTSAEENDDNLSVLAAALEVPVSAHVDIGVSSDLSEDLNMRIHPYQHERWMERYQDLVDYYRINGHCNVPYVYKANPCLGQWVKRQRHQYKLRNQGQHSNLTEDRIQILDMLGFIWDSHGASWEEKFLELKEFRNIHGHCNVPCIYKGTSKLSTWLKRQRRQYRLFVGNKPSTMDYERITRLEILGFVWDYYGGKSNPVKLSR